MWNKNKETEKNKKQSEPAKVEPKPASQPEAGKDKQGVDAKPAQGAEMPTAGKSGVEPQPVEDKDKKIAGLTDTLLRLQAEFENYKKRVEREKAEIFKIASVRLATEFLTILDDFERVPTAEIKDEKLRKGVEMIAGNFRKILDGDGVKQIPADGLVDPHNHEVLMWVERADLPEGTIVSVLQKGYSLNGKILRPARVSVSKKPEKIQDKKEDTKNKKMEEVR